MHRRRAALHQRLDVKKRAQHTAAFCCLRGCHCTPPPPRPTKFFEMERKITTPCYPGRQEELQTRSNCKVIVFCFASVMCQICFTPSISKSVNRCWLKDKKQVLDIIKQVSTLSQTEDRMATAGVVTPTSSGKDLLPLALSKLKNGVCLMFVPFKCVLKCFCSSKTT